MLADEVQEVKKVVKKKIKKVVKKKKEVTKEKKTEEVVISEEKEVSVSVQKETSISLEKEEKLSITKNEARTDNREIVKPKNESVVIEAPVDVTTAEGESAVVYVRVASVSNVLGGGCLNVSWIKGKWSELSKGDRYEMWSKEQHPNGVEHFLRFRQPKKSDTGPYRVKVVSPNGEEEFSFNVTVTPSVVSEKKLEIVKKGKLPEQKSATDKDMNFRNRLKKVERSKMGVEGGGDVWTWLRAASTQRDYESIAFKFGIVDMRAMLRRVNRLNKTAGKNLIKSKAFYQRLPETRSALLGEKMVFEVEVTNEKMTVKWEKDGVELDNEDGKYQIVTNGSKRCLVIDKADGSDTALFTCAVGSDVTACEVFVQVPPTTIVKGFDDVEALCGETACFQCQISNEDGAFKTLKDGGHILYNDRIKLQKDGSLVSIVINQIEASDEGFYQLVTNGGSTCSELLVRDEHERTAANYQPPSDIMVNVDEKAEIFCEVSGDSVRGEWVKDDLPLQVEKEKRFATFQEGNERKLVISQVRDSDCGEYCYVMSTPDHGGDSEVRSPTTNIGACLSPSSAADDPFNVTIEKENNEPAKLFLDCSESSDVVRVKAGAQLKLKLANPEGSRVKWSKDGKELSEEESRVKTGASEGATEAILLVDRTQIADSGKYTMTVDDDGADESPHSSSINVEIVDLPPAPSKPQVADVTTETCSVTWSPPSDDVTGSSGEIKGYVVERRKVGSERWIRLNTEPVPGCRFEARRLIESVEYQMRVRACNQVGVGPPSAPSDPFTPLGTCEPPSSFRLSSASDDSISLGWRAPNETSMSGIEGYRLEVSECLGGEESVVWRPAFADRELLPPGDEGASVGGLTTGSKYKFRLCAVNKAGPSSYIEMSPVVCAAVVEPAKIILPRAFSKPINVRAGDKLHINIPFQGRPKPMIKWSKGGEEVDSTRVTIRNSLDSTVLFIRNTELGDSGEYVMELRVGDDQLQTATLRINVIDLPSKPIGVKLVEVIETSAQITWEPPKDDGNTDVLGYIIEKRDARCDIWYVVNDKLRHTRSTVYDLVAGNSYFFQVRAFNMVGAGEPAVLKDAVVIPKERSRYKRPEFRHFDERTKPEFTQPLRARRIVENYNSTLSCALRSNPRPKIRWYKNSTEIIDNPKYKMSHEMGIVQLEIRRARAADAGIYSVVATNELGEATTTTQVTFKDGKLQD